MIAGNEPTRIGPRLALSAVLTIALVAGCRRNEPQAGPSAPAQTADSAEVAALRRAMTRGMVAVAFDRLTEAQVGKRCVVVARTPERADPPPPPLGMVRRLGATTVYTAEVDAVSPAGLKIRAAYPTSNNLKIIEIPPADIQSIDIAP